MTTLRERTAQEIYKFLLARPLEWDELLESTRNNFRKQADQILQAFKEWLGEVELPKFSFSEEPPNARFGYGLGQQDTIKAIIREMWSE